MKLDKHLNQNWSRYVQSRIVVSKTDKQDLDRLELALQAVEYERCMSHRQGTS